ncbi:urease accessory protein UreD [Streptomyces sp. NBC_01497]|uniref:urease accessory protein UreD n=1 Tax=Streptomyces sp. NBC_01497 TaxID=2903885 RepID=UPI002E370D2C|nr:urease accessory protein UreD [Streptomyces sp. NBC_01497]
MSGGVRATARIVATRDGLTVLSGEGPLAPRRTRAVDGGLRVTLVGAMSAPLGGDRLAVEIDVRPGAELTVDAAAATIALPGREGGAAHYDVRIVVAAGATLRWLPGPLVSVAGSLLFLRTRAELAQGARLVAREELVLGRHGEASGTVTSRLSVRYGGMPLLDQETASGPGAPPGWDGGAVLGGHRALGQLLCVEPDFENAPVPSRSLGESAVLTPLAGPAALATAVAADGLRLRKTLDAAFAALRDVRPGA